MTGAHRAVHSSAECVCLHFEWCEGARQTRQQRHRLGSRLFDANCEIYEEKLVIPETVSSSAKYPRHPQIPTIRDTLTVIFLGPYLWLWCLLICIKKAHFCVWVKKQNRSKIFLLCSSRFVYVRGRWYRSCGSLAPLHALSVLHSTASACTPLSLPLSFTRRLPKLYSTRLAT